MKPLLVIRKHKPSDNFACQDVIKEYVMSFVGEAFLSCLFREVIKLFNFPYFYITSGLYFNKFLYRIDYITINRSCVGNYVHIFWYATIYMHLGDTNCHNNYSTLCLFIPFYKSH